MYSEAQAAEISKYTKCYQSPRYAMGITRREQSERALANLPWRGSYLDIGCGRGEMLDYARRLGFDTVAGTEVVPELLGGDVQYAVGWDLPFEDNSFEVVTFWDVIEHILPGDDEAFCREAARVASKAILLTASNKESKHEGIDLHVNKRPYEQWDSLFKVWFGGSVVTWLDLRTTPVSEMWQILL